MNLQPLGAGVFGISHPLAVNHHTTITNQLRCWLFCDQANPVGQGPGVVTWKGKGSKRPIQCIQCAVWRRVGIQQQPAGAIFERLMNIETDLQWLEVWSHERRSIRIKGPPLQSLQIEEQLHIRLSACAGKHSPIEARTEIHRQLGVRAAQLKPISASGELKDVHLSQGINLRKLRTCSARIFVNQQPITGEGIAKERWKIGRHQRQAGWIIADVKTGEAIGNQTGVNNSVDRCRSAVHIAARAGQKCGNSRICLIWDYTPRHIKLVIPATALQNALSIPGRRRRWIRSSQARHATGEILNASIKIRVIQINRIAVGPAHLQARGRGIQAENNRVGRIGQLS